MINKTKIDINSLNRRSNASPSELIELAERNYFLQIKRVANFVVKNKKASILLLAGPSASSKTTTAQKLSEELLKNKIKSIVISLDDFYIDRDKLPLLPNGEIDYESIKTLDLEKLSQCFGELINDKKSELPIFDFSTGCRSKKT
ncbi:MAG: nucleoside kinase, partial [Oscillospiraceae bacterium]